MPGDGTRGQSLSVSAALLPLVGSVSCPRADARGPGRSRDCGTITFTEMATMWTARMGLLGLLALAAGCGASRSATTEAAPRQQGTDKADSSSSTVKARSTTGTTAT